VAIAPYVARFALVAGASGSLAATAACGPGNSCEVYLTCPTSSAGTGGAGLGGATGGAGAGGGTGGTAPSCGDGIVQPGEVCFTAPGMDYPTQGEQGAALVVVDCDGDGDLDAVTAHRGSGTSLSTLRNDGNGVFDQIVKSTSGFGEHVALDMVDLGGGAFEIATISNVSGRIEWWTQDPTIGCGFNATISQPLVGAPVAVRYLDVNGNANPDNVRVLAAVPQSAPATYDVTVDHEISGTSAWPGTSTPTAAITGDFLGDSGDDIVIVDSNQSRLLVFENQAGAFSNRPLDVPPGGVGAMPMAIALGDLDRDGVLDIVTANQQAGTIAVLRNLGGGGFAVQAPEPSVGRGASPVAVAIGDLNGDGSLDAVTANDEDGVGRGSLSIFLNDGSGKLVLYQTLLSAVLRNPTGIARGDLNGDGAVDIVTISSHVEGGTSQLSVLIAQP
jgi:hypothetical protein